MTISVHPMIFVQEGQKKISVKSGSIPYVCKTAKSKEKIFSSYFNSNFNEENDYFELIYDCCSPYDAVSIVHPIKEMSSKV